MKRKEHVNEEVFTYVSTQICMSPLSVDYRLMVSRVQKQGGMVHMHLKKLEEKFASSLI